MTFSSACPIFFFKIEDDVLSEAANFHVKELLFYESSNTGFTLNVKCQPVVFLSYTYLSQHEETICDVTQGSRSKS